MMKKNNLPYFLCFILSLIGFKTFSQNNYCRGVVTPTVTTNPFVSCAQDWHLFTPSVTQDTTVVNVAVMLYNQTALPNSSINQLADSTFYHWIWNLNHKYSHIQQAVQNVGNTPYIPDTRIRFKLIGVFKKNGGPVYPAGTKAVILNIHAGVDGNGDLSGGAEAWEAGPLSQNANIEFFLPAGDFIRDGLSMSGNFRTGQLSHEMGHILGLKHPDGEGAYTHGCGCGDDGFSDTYFPDCSSTSGAQCGTDEIVVGFLNGNNDTCTYHGIITNNVMGYNGCQNYFSPQQMAYMFYKLNTVYLSFCSIYPPSPYCITSPMVTTEIPSFTTALYNQTHIMSGDIIVRPNATLTITGCVFMPWKSKIYVMQGGKLVVDGGTITSLCTEKMWGGIEVRGTEGAIQIYGKYGNTVYDPNQGICEVKNNSSISRARIGIYAGANANYLSIPNIAAENKYTGGIIRVDHSTIRDCYIGVAFAQYSKMAVTISYITNSTFSSRVLAEPFFNINGLETPMQYGIYLNSINKVLIRNNTFKQYKVQPSIDIGISNILSQDVRGTAIYAFNSVLSVEKDSIINYRYGIKAVNNYAIIRNAVIKKNVLLDNMYGITGNLSYATIDTNTFIVPQGLIDTVNIPLGSSKYPYGIYLDNSHTFKLQCDSFITKYVTSGGGGTTGGSLLLLDVTATPPLSSYGLIVKNSGNIGGEVKGNCFFGGLNIATQTEQSNPNLQIRCNKYENNTVAWRVNPQSTTGVLGTQGTSCVTTSGAQYRANNTFLGCFDGKDLFESYLSTPFNYFYWDNNGTTSDFVLKPCTTAVNNTVNLNPCTGIGTDDPNACPAAPVNLVQLKEIREQVLLFVQKEQYDEAANYLLTFVNDDEVKKLLISYYYEKGDFQNMQQLLAQLADNKQEKKQFKKLFHILKNLKQQDKDIKQLSNSQKRDIRDIAVTETQAGAFARSILDAIGDKENNINPEVPYTSSSILRFAKTIEEPVIKDREAELGQNIPNPASNSVLINLYVPEKAIAAKVIVLNSLGQLMFEKTLAKGEQQINIATGDFNNGIYFYTMFVDGKAIASKRMVIVK